MHSQPSRRGSVLRWIVPPLAAVAAGLGLTPPAEAFCVYNKTSYLKFCVNQTAGHRQLSDITFGANKWLEPGQELCCNWQEKSCNTGGARTSDVKLTIGFGCADYLNSLQLCRSKEITIQAGGWIDVTVDANGHPSCTVHKP
jgi:hypothetical protein